MKLQEGWYEITRLRTPCHSFVCQSVALPYHYTEVIIGAKAYQITSLTIVYSTVYSDADQRKHQSSASLAFVWGIHRRPVNSPHKWPVTRKMFPFDDIIMTTFRICKRQQSLTGYVPTYDMVLSGILSRTYSAYSLEHFISGRPFNNQNVLIASH